MWYSEAENIYNSGGVEVFKKFWASLKAQQEILNDAEFASFLSESVHGSVADVMLKWDE